MSISIPMYPQINILVKKISHKSQILKWSNRKSFFSIKINGNDHFVAVLFACFKA